MGPSRVQRQGTACLGRASTALMELLDKLHSTENPRNMDHLLCEFGSVRYHLQASATDSRTIYLSMSTPLLSSETNLVKDHSSSALQEIRRTYPDVVEVAETAEAGFTLTVKINLARMPQGKEDYAKLLSSISSLQAVVLSSQLNEILWNLGSHDISCGYRTTQLVFRPGEPFFVIRMPEKFNVIFPMRFNEDTDVVIAASLFQGLMEAGDSPACAKAPACTWSPIPPPELRGESLQSLSTNGGFVSFEICANHMRGEKMERTAWFLLNFYAFVKHYIKCTRGFVHVKMRQRLESLSEVLQKANIAQEKNFQKVEQGRIRCRKGLLLKVSKSRVLLRRTCGALARRVRRICPPVWIQVQTRFRRRWLRMPGVSSLRRYAKLG